MSGHDTPIPRRRTHGSRDFGHPGGDARRPATCSIRRRIDTRGPGIPAAADHGDCAQLTQLKLPDVAITEAVAVPAGTGAIKVAHCRVNGVIGTEIKFSLLLPDDWNHKFLMGGGGGFVGRIDNQAQFVVNAGYATVGTDTGHSGGVTDASWALNNEERRINFGYLAVHRTAETSKAIIRSYYGAPQTRAYFSGCSNGGRQGLMEAQRYPDDFDGIVAGAPAARLHRHRRAVPQGRARAVSGSEEPHAAALARDDADGGGAGSEYVRRARRREGRRDGGSAAVQG